MSPGSADIARSDRPVRTLIVGVALCHAVASASLYVQLPGLLGSHGILPADAFLKRVRAAAQSRGTAPEKLLPTLLWPLARLLPGGVDSALGVLCLSGVALSSAVATAAWRQIRPGGFVIASALAALHVQYLSVVAAGQAFLSFQWDILLLEATFAAAVLATVRSSLTAVWIPRLLLFKLMLQSGAVKLQSGCPTWSRLTALEYHFATQPLPTVPAWYAAQMPPGILRVACAGALAIEGPLAFLLLSPLPTAQRFSSLCQAMFMVSIALSGNYCFFNLLTAILAMACMNGNAAGAWERWLSTALICIVAGICVSCFKLGPAGQPLKGLHLTLSAKEMTDTLAWVLPMTLNLVFRCIVPVTTLQDVVLKDRAMRSRQAKRGPRLLSAAVACASGAVTLVAGAIIAAPLASLLSDGGALTAALPGLPPAIISIANTGRFASSYGLFRVMTGVGPDGSVARPELIIQGRNSSINGDDSPPWVDIAFRYKPGDTHLAPAWVAPHQPRLDWQMWFAALGRGVDGNSAWVVHFAAHLLRGERDVYALLASGPFTADTPPAEVRIMAFTYAFTGAGKPEWWVRANSREWLPPLHLDSPGLDGFLQQNGWVGVRQARRRRHALKTVPLWMESAMRGGELTPAALAALAALAGPAFGVASRAASWRRHMKVD